jgi:hypothetical protein
VGHRPRRLGATDAARLELAYELLDELRTVAEQRRATKNRITRIVAAAKTSVTDIYGVGPIFAATVLGRVGRFPTRDRFAAYNGTAPIDVSSGNNNVQRLSRRGNRQLNHALHMAALTQIRYHDTVGRTYYDRKIAEGMKHKSALRALKRKISDTIYAHLIADARHTRSASSSQESYVTASRVSAVTRFRRSVMYSSGGGRGAKLPTSSASPRLAPRAARPAHRHSVNEAAASSTCLTRRR